MPTICVDFLSFNIIGIGYDIEICMFCGDTNHGRETRHHRFWKRDSLAIKILSREMLEQKLEYCHNNPLQAHWNLALEPEGYYYSSAFDYANNMCRFSFLQHYWDRV